MLIENLALLLNDVLVLRLNLYWRNPLFWDSRMRWVIRYIITTSIFYKWILRRVNQFVCARGYLTILFVVRSYRSRIAQRALITFTFRIGFIFLEFLYLVWNVYVIEIWDRFLIENIQIVLIFFRAWTQSKVPSPFPNGALLMPLIKSFNLISSIISILNALGLEIVWAAVESVLILANLTFMFWWRQHAYIIHFLLIIELLLISMRWALDFGREIILK